MILSNCQAQGPGQSSGQDQVIQNQSPITGHGSDKFTVLPLLIRNEIN